MSKKICFVWCFMKTKSFTFIGTALMLAMAGAPVRAEEAGSQPTEIRLSPQAMEILCKNFPQNSRCVGKPNNNPSAGNQPQPSAAPAPAPAPTESEAKPSPASAGDGRTPSNTTPTPAGGSAKFDLK
jgi:hypothetical protein